MNARSKQSIKKCRSDTLIQILEKPQVKKIYIRINVMVWILLNEAQKSDCVNI